jgi:hypothetical protein
MAPMQFYRNYANSIRQNYRVNWKYAITIFKDWRSAIKNHLIGNLPLQFNHKPKFAIAIPSDMEIDHGNPERYWKFAIQF